MNIKTKENLLKTLIIFTIYISYTYIFNVILKSLNINDDVLIMFIADIVFLIGIIFTYKDYIIKNIKELTKKNSFKNIFLFLLKWVFVLLVINLIGGFITELINPSVGTDENTQAIYSLASISTIYTIFKTMIFATIAEELVFKKSIRDVIKNKYVFAIIGGIIYAVMNIAYSSLSFVTVLDFIQCFIFFLVTSYIYIKNDDNVLLVILVKFMYNLIPLVILLTEIGG